MDNEKLAAAAKTGDYGALMGLWESVRRLCFQIARRYKNMLAWAGYTHEDIEQECFIAFCKAVEAFDPESGYLFSTYLTRPVMNALRAALGIRSSRELPPVPLSLNEPLGEMEDGDTRGSLVPDSGAERAFEDAKTRIWNERLHDALEQCLATLEGQQAEAIRGTYYEGLTAEETGKRLNVSASKATRLKRSGQRKLRQGKNLRRLREFREEINAGIYHGTGWNIWRYSGNSVEERAVMRLEELENST